MRRKVAFRHQKKGRIRYGVNVMWSVTHETGEARMVVVDFFRLNNTPNIMKHQG